MTLPHDLNELQAKMREAVRANWKAFLVEGILLAILGIAAVIVPQVASLAVTILLGWLFLIMQGTGAGFATLLLYKRAGNRFVPATKKPLGDLAWDYFFSQPISEGMPTEPDQLNHQRADLLKGMEENYAWLGVKWPDSRYVVVTLQFDTQGNDRKTPWIEGWRCVYDTQTGKFSVPSSFAEHNAQARKLPKSKAAHG